MNPRKTGGLEIRPSLDRQMNSCTLPSPGTLAVMYVAWLTPRNGVLVAMASSRGHRR